MIQPEIQFLDIESRKIAYRLRKGGSPTLVFFPGYASDMDGTKALALDAFGYGFWPVADGVARGLVLTNAGAPAAAGAVRGASPDA